MNNSENNLVGFYRAVGTLQSVQSEVTDQFSIISSSNGFWPQLVYRFHFESNTEENLGKLMEEMAHSNCKMLAICNKEEFGNLNQDKLREASVFPVETWSNMEISEMPAEKDFDNSGFEFRQLTILSDFSEFTNLVNTGMMTTLKIADDFFAELAQNPQFEFYGLFAENELVSGLVIFTENDIAGLYFIVTKSTFRGKGLAEILIRKTLKRLIEKGTESVVLQAVNKAVNLYSRIGFTAQKKLVILMKY
jgi:ribosomal protein S18 acetylase RimI-like enzyme